MLNRIRYIFARRQNIRAHFWQSSANYVQTVGGLSLGVLLARILQPADFGQFAYAQAIVFLAQQAVNWNLSQALLATRCQDLSLVKEAWHLETWASTFKMLITLAIGCFFFLADDQTLAILVLVCGLPPAVNGYTNLLRAELESKGNFKSHLLSSILVITVSFLIGVPLALNGFGPLALALPGLPLMILQPLLYRKLTSLTLPRSIRLGRVSFSPLRNGFSLWLCTASEHAIFRLDKVLLGKFTNPQTLGNYSRAYGYAPISHFALSSLYTNPTVAALGHKPDWSAKKKLLTKHLAILLPAAIVNALFWWSFSDPVVPLVFGPQWAPAIPVFEAMATLSLCMAAYYLPAAYLFHSKDFLALGLIRLTIVLAMLATGLLFHNQLTAPIMAYLLQASLLMTSISLIIRCAILVKSACSHNVSSQI